MRLFGQGVVVLAMTLTLAPSCAVRRSTEASAMRPSPAALLAEMKTLAGPWEGVSSSGRSSRVAYRVSAGDSVLVETWTQARGREALTIYHLDGAELLATHDCPKGNQVRLRWTGGSLSEGMRFEFLDGTNLQVEGQAHQHAVWLKRIDADSFQRGETYVKNGSSAKEIAATPVGEAITYRRVPRDDGGTGP